MLAIRKRLALGVRRSQLVRLLLLESFPYALAGGLGGILLAFWTVDLFVAAAPNWFPRIENVELNWPVLIFCLATACLTPFLFGLAPVLQALKLNVNSASRGGQRAPGMDRRRGRSYALLVSGEIAMACLLVVGAGLLTKSYANLFDWRSGFEPDNLAITQLFISPGKYTTGEEVSMLYHRAVEELGAVPGVISAAGGSAVPLMGGTGSKNFPFSAVLLLRVKSRWWPGSIRHPATLKHWGFHSWRAAG